MNKLFISNDTEILRLHNEVLRLKQELEEATNALKTVKKYLEKYHPTSIFIGFIKDKLQKLGR